ncbi:hypothetical protein MLD38_037544 [Melastoma candidum]|uniref:Uncharacterized protein n=1 Tax=Melastoma candidum TaxID=119954 RepID=A0ACB9LP74_9MYRT|nr:hypothetical protein MLD38_037544 [Melastoma candidum]
MRMGSRRRNRSEGEASRSRIWKQPREVPPRLRRRQGGRRREVDSPPLPAEEALGRPWFVVARLGVTAGRRRREVRCGGLVQQGGVSWPLLVLRLTGKLEQGAASEPELDARIEALGVETTVGEDVGRMGGLLLVIFQIESGALKEWWKKWCKVCRYHQPGEVGEQCLPSRLQRRWLQGQWLGLSDCSPRFQCAGIRILTSLLYPPFRLMELRLIPCCLFEVGTVRWKKDAAMALFNRFIRPSKLPGC